MTAEMSRQNEELEVSNGQLKANEKVIMNEQVRQQLRPGQQCDIRAWADCYLEHTVKSEVHFRC